MTRMLEKAFAEASKLPESEQNELAGLILAELEADRGWDRLFERNPDQLRQLALEAREDYRAGRTELTDFDEG